MPSIILEILSFAEEFFLMPTAIAVSSSLHLNPVSLFTSAAYVRESFEEQRSKAVGSSAIYPSIVPDVRAV